MTNTPARCPLDLNATIVGPVVELRYPSHIEAFRQLRTLRARLAQHALMLAALEEAHHFMSFTEQADAPHMQRLAQVIATNREIAS